MRQYYKSAYKFSVLVLTLFFVGAAMGFVLASSVCDKFAAGRDSYAVLHPTKHKVLQSAMVEFPDNLPNYDEMPPAVFIYTDHTPAGFRAIGTGVVVMQMKKETECVEYVLTAEHVSSASGAIYIKQRRATLVRANINYDLALMKVTHPECMSPDGPISINVEFLPYGSVIFNIAHPLGIEAILTSGFSGTYQFMNMGLQARIPLLLASIPSAPGSSGSPVFDKDGYLVGILIGGDHRIPVLSTIVPGWAIEKFMNDKDNEVNLQ